MKRKSNVTVVQSAKQPNFSATITGSPQVLVWSLEQLHLTASHVVNKSLYTRIISVIGVSNIIPPDR
jgi:hypothetical protein